MLDRFKEYLREDMADDPWLADGSVKTETADITESTALDDACFNAQDPEIDIEETEERELKTTGKAIRRTGRSMRRGFRMPMRAVAFALLFLFAVTSDPTRMVAEAATKYLSGTYTVLSATQLRDESDSSLVNFAAGDKFTLNNAVTLNMNGQNLSINKIDGNEDLIVTGSGILTVGSAGEFETKMSVKDLSIDTARIDATSGLTSGASAAVEISGSLTMSNGAILHAETRPLAPNTPPAINVTNEPAGLLLPAGAQWQLSGGRYNLQDANGVMLTSATISVSAAGVVTSGSHTHNYEWVTVKEATEDENGEADYICKGCGHVLMSIPLSGCGVFNVNAANRIKKAPQGGTVKISTNRWLSFHHMVFDALAERPDVTVQVDFLEQGHKGAKKRIVIPAGTDVQSLLDSNGYAGFLYLASKLGTVPVE